MTTPTHVPGESEGSLELLIDPMEPSMKQAIIKTIILYYASAAVFAVLSYGLILVVYGRTEVSFLEWAVIMLVAFTIGYVPSFIKLVRNSRQGNM